jgi:hypothetical protein
MRKFVSDCCFSSKFLMLYMYGSYFLPLIPVGGVQAGDHLTQQPPQLSGAIAVDLQRLSVGVADIALSQT